MSIRIALVTYNWPPRNAIGTHRPYGWAKYWSRLGADVTVLTARKREFDEPLNSELPTLPGVRLIEVDYRSALPWGGYAGRRLRGQRFISSLKQINRFARSKVGVVLDPRDGWAESSREVATSVAREVDVVVSTFGPRSSHFIAAGMKRQVPSLLWVADYRDLWSNSHMGGYSRLAQRIQTLKERDVVGRGADLVTTVSDELAVDLRNLLAKPTYVIPNGFDAEECLTEQPLASAQRRLVYTGMLYPGTRDPSPLFSALAKLRERNELRRGEIFVEFYGPLDPWLATLIESYDLREFVRMCDRVSRPEALSIQRSSDVLLLLESGESKANGVLTGKLFEYLAAGRPILSLGSGRDSAIARVLTECGVGVCAGNDDDAICQVIRTLLNNAKFSWYQPKPERIAAYSRDRQSESLLAVIQNELTARRVNGAEYQSSTHHVGDVK